MTAVIEGEVARGEKAVLRQKRPEDAANDYEWRKDPELAGYDAAKPIKTSFEEYKALYEDDLANLGAFRRTFAMEDVDGRHIGNIMFYNIDLLRHEAEIGVTIGVREFWSRGYGTDALRTLVDYLFAETPLTRLYLKTLDWNHRAQRSFEKAGFVRYATSRRTNGTFVLMELRKEWSEGKAAS